MKRKKVIITGSNSKISSYLLNNFSKNNIELLGMSRKVSDYLSPQENLLGELYDDTFLDKSLKDVDVVIHAAALTRSTNKKKLYNSNELITKKLIKYCEKNNISKFIFLSTDLANNPVGNYGKSKLACENLVKDSKIKDWIILRLSPVIFSTKGDPRTTFGKMFQSIENKNLIFLPNSGNFNVSPLLACDLLEIIKNIIDFKKTIKEILPVKGKEYRLKNLILNIRGSHKKKIRIVGISSKIIKFVIFISIKLQIRLHVYESLLHIFQNNKVDTKRIIKLFNYKPTRIF